MSSRKMPERSPAYAAYDLALLSWVTYPFVLVAELATGHTGSAALTGAFVLVLTVTALTVGRKAGLSPNENLAKISRRSDRSG